MPGIRVIAVMLVGSIFMGITAVSLGVGAVFPAINDVAQPFLCSGGHFETTHRVYRPYPGKTVTSITYHCVDETSARRDVSLLPISLTAGSIYGLLLFALLFVGRLVRARK